MTTLATILLWLLIGDLLSALRPWEDDELEYAIWFRITWPIRVYWVFRRLLTDWRHDLYRRAKYR